ncbi:MAG: aminotransferase class III-fold pyridoxal phosphate-dependent enzyme [Pseudomonadota bacterium]
MSNTEYMSAYVPSLAKLEFNRDASNDFVEGRGIYSIDRQGKELIEGFSMFFTMALGHDNARVKQAIVDQLEKLPVYATGLFNASDPTLRLAEKLRSICPIENAFVAYGASGSETIDHLMKLMLVGNHYSGRAGRRRIITHNSEYHGSTTSTFALTYKNRAQAWGLSTDHSIQIAEPRWPRDAEAGESEEDYTHRLVSDLRHTIKAVGAETIGGFIAEPISMHGGLWRSPKDYWAKVQETLREFEIDIYLDEIISGFGRYGRFFAAEVADINADAIVCGKGMTGGYQPLAALLMGNRFYERVKAGSRETGGFMHASTFSGHPLASVAALAVIEEMETWVLHHAEAITPLFASYVDEVAQHAQIFEARQCGLCAAFDLVDATPDDLYKFYLAARDAGIHVRPYATHFVIAPPLVSTKEELKLLRDRLLEALDEYERAPEIKRRVT